MVASNELDGTYIVETARMLFELCVRIQKEAGVRISFIDMGGESGFPIDRKTRRWILPSFHGR